ncbi:MAG: FeoA family protein [Bacillota bacterium]
MEQVNKVRTINNTLLSLKSSQRAKVIRIDTNDNLKIRKLNAFGITPGTYVTVIQKYPSVVIQVGFTQVALDNEIASQIVVSEKVE